MIQPNNFRNRWRRYSQTRAAYGMSWLPIRYWVRTSTPNSYATIPGYKDEHVELTACRCRKGAMVCLCRVSRRA